MAKKQAYWWKIGHALRELTYGAGTTGMDRWYRIDNPILMQTSGEEETDEQEIKGYMGISAGGADVMREKAGGKVSIAGNVQMIGHALASILANDNFSGAGDPYSHVFKQPTYDEARPWSFSVMEGQDRAQSSSFFQYDGIVVSSLELTVEQGGKFMMNLDLFGDGSETAIASEVPPAIGTSLKGDRLRFEHVTCKLGPLGTEDVSGVFRKFSLKFSADIQEEPRASRGTKVGTIFYGADAPSVECSLVLEGRKGDTVWNYWKNRTALKLDFLAELSASRSLRIQANSVEIPKDAGELVSIENGIVPVLTIPLRFHYVTADASAYLITALNDIATAYLQTA